ncbi:unnamed protein product [Leptosia nina]|uniref:FERM domain-containing protein n=1 Tax=Leptosia nina TaxID=320188 RepID=A0AAV1JP03_9NEOP
MPRNCDEDSGHSSCTEQAPTVSPHMDNYLKSNHIFKTKEYRDNETNKNLVVSTKPRNNISLVKSPDMGEPFPSCRISNEQRRPIFNFFENPRMINPSNAHSTLNVPCNTDFQNSKIKINSGLVSALNKENLSKTKHPSNVFKRCKPVQRAASRLYKAESLKGKDACVGPEFIVRASQPARNIDLTVSGICEKRVITVVLLNGQKIEVLCDPNTITAGQLFEALIQSEKYEHNFMLGIAVLIGGDFIFLPDDYKIKKIAAEPWSKNLNKRKNNDDAVSLTVFLRIKFFLPKNIASNVQGGDWMYRVYLQLRRATVEGQMISTIQNLILLAGYALHIEFGEFSYREHGTADYFLLEHYLPESLITTDMADIKLRMKKSHESRRGLEKNRAVINYITLAQTFRDYGAHFYSAVWATRDGFCRDVWLSIGPRGITLYSRTNHMLDSSTSNRIVLQSLPWHHIHNFYHNKKSLYILPNAYSGVYKMGIKYKLKISDNKAYFVFWLASLHHRLYLKLYAKDDFISYLTNALNSPIRSESPKKSEVSNYQDSYNLAVRNPVRVRRPLRRRLQVDLFGNKKLQNKKPDTVELFQQILSAELSDESIVHSPTNDIGNMSNDGLSSSESSLPRRHRVKMGTRVFNGMKFSSANNHLISPQNNMFTKSEGDLTATHSDSDEINSSQKQECCVNSMKLLPERPYSQNICQSPTAYVLESPKVYSDVFKYEVYKLLKVPTEMFI